METTQSFELLKRLLTLLSNDKVLARFVLTLENFEKINAVKDTSRLEDQHKFKEHLKPFLSLEETVEYLCVSKSTLYKYVHSKRIPYYKPSGSKLYFKVDDLNNFVLNKNKSICIHQN